jgi:hypothetical protein
MTAQEFPLAWRWTQPSHSVLPAEVLAGIRPLSAPEAARLCTTASPRGSSVVSHSASDSADVSRWLRSIQPDSQVPVYVGWSEELAVEMSWGIFTQYWDDFCYPSSDDVMVAPVTGTWQLVYHHHEQFDFIAGS